MGCGALRFIACSILKTYPDWIQVSSTLDIINGYTRFAIAFFEVISTSAPHIYHSALPLSPRTSIVRDRYKQYARPLARVVWGALASWEQCVATMHSHRGVSAIAWSPCNRFTAVARFGPKVVELLDAATLGLLDVFRLPSGWMWLGDRPLLIFSPDSRSPTLSVRGRIITWDLQTGGEAANLLAEHEGGSSSTCSIDGRLFAVLSQDHDNSPHITAYDLLLGTHATHFHTLTGRAAPPIWTHGGCIRFATVKNRSIAISEAGFSSTHTPVEVESFPAPGRIARARTYLFTPALSRLAFILSDEIEVWDAQHSRTLLECTGNGASEMSFSTDGHLFAYIANLSGEVHVWKGSATGYELHQRLPSISLGVGKLVFSPSGNSIILARESIYPLSTAGPILSPSGISTEFGGFFLAFSPDESLAAVARTPGNTITTVDLKSGHRRLVVATGMRTGALGVTGSTLLAVGDGKALTWTIPTRDDVFNAQTNINNSVRTTILDQPGLPPGDLFGSASISPGYDRVAVLGFGSPGHLIICDITTGKYLGGIKTRAVGTPRFTPDGREVWVAGFLTVGGPPLVEGWAIVENEGSGFIELETLESAACPLGVFPGRSSRGHQVHDGWVLNSAQERILWLPHHWRSAGREWRGRFFGLLHEELPEAVILELCD